MTNSIQGGCSKGVCCTIQFGEDAGICMLDNCRCHSKPQDIQPSCPDCDTLSANVGEEVKCPAHQDIQPEWESEFVEAGAALEHERWAKWQAYVHSKCVEHENGKGEWVYFPSDSFRHWQRQIETPYADLSEQEKESDRKEARTYLPLIRKLLQDHKQKILEELPKTLTFTGREDFGLKYADGWNEALSQAKKVVEETNI